MAGIFGDHQLGIPYQPVAELLAKYRARDPGKTAIVDLDQATQISFGELDQVATDIAAGLKRQGIRKGSKVLLLSDENLEKLLIWLGAWRLGAVICPFNAEINERQIAALTATLNPALIIYHKDIDVAAMVGDADAPRLRFGAWSAGTGNDPQDEFFSSLARGCRAAGLPGGAASWSRCSGDRRGLPGSAAVRWLV